MIHEAPRKPIHALLISVAPALVNTVLGALIAFPAALPIHHDHGRWHDMVLMWLGISIAMHAFPSIGDANSMWSSVWAPGGYWLLRLLSLPVVVVIYLGALGSVFWLDVIYGTIVAVFLPAMIVNFVA